MKKKINMNLEITDQGSACSIGETSAGLSRSVADLMDLESFPLVPVQSGSIQGEQLPWNRTIRHTRILGNNLLPCFGLSGLQKPTSLSVGGFLPRLALFSCNNFRTVTTA